MTEPTNHTVTAPVVYVKDLGGGKAEEHIETTFYIETGYNYPATYATASHEAKGKYKTTSAGTFTPQQTYIHKGEFVRDWATMISPTG